MCESEQWQPKDNYKIVQKVEIKKIEKKLLTKGKNDCIIIHIITRIFLAEQSALKKEYYNGKEIC